MTIDLRIERADLVDRLDARVDGMWHDGLVDEVARLAPAAFGVHREQGDRLRAGPRADSTADVDEQRRWSRPQPLTRRYARRQVAWFGRYRDAVGSTPTIGGPRPDSPGSG